MNHPRHGWLTTEIQFCLRCKHFTFGCHRRLQELLFLCVRLSVSSSVFGHRMPSLCSLPTFLCESPKENPDWWRHYTSGDPNWWPRKPTYVITLLWNHQIRHLTVDFSVHYDILLLSRVQSHKPTEFTFSHLYIIMQGASGDQCRCSPLCCNQMNEP